MVNNNLWFQQGPQRQVTPPAQQQVNQQISPSQPVNPQYIQLNIQQSSVFAPQQFSTQYPLPYPGQWPQQLPSVHSNTTETSEVLTQVLGTSNCMKIERMPMNNAKGRKKNERSAEMKQTTATGSTRHLKRSTGLTDTTQTNAYHGWRRYLPWPAPTREIP